MPGYKHKGGYSRTNDLLGKRFSRYVVIAKAEPYYNKDGTIQCAGWLCKCDCGNVKRVRGNSLVMNKTKSCGCANREKPSNNITHHMSNSIIYMKYKGMKARCYNPNCKAFKHYGARGILVCDEWVNNFESFYQWSIANGYSDKLSLERIDVNGNYEPTNCKWILFKEQAFNKRNSILTDSGESIAKLAREIGIVPPNIARGRYKNGWSLYNALHIPVLKKGERFEKSEAFDTRTEENR